MHLVDTEYPVSMPFLPNLLSKILSVLLVSSNVELPEDDKLKSLMRQIYVYMRWPKVIHSHVIEQNDGQVKSVVWGFGEGQREIF